MKDIRKFNDEYENWIMLEIQTILQIFLQTADIVSDYW